MFTSSEELSGRGQKTVESLTSVTSVKALYGRVSKVIRFTEVWILAIDVTLSQESHKAVEALASVTSVKALYARVSKATDGLRQAFMDELVASLA